MANHISIRPCKVVIERCSFFPVQKEKRKKTKEETVKTVSKQKKIRKTSKQVLTNDLCTTTDENFSNETRKVILKKFGDKIIAVICNKRQNQDAHDMPSELQNSSVQQIQEGCIDDQPSNYHETSETVIKDSEKSTITLPTLETPESYRRLSFGTIPSKQYYSNDVSLSNSLGTPVLQPTKESMLTNDSPIINDSLNISTNLFQDLVDVNSPVTFSHTANENTANDDVTIQPITDREQGSSSDRDLDETDQSMEPEEVATLFRVAESLLLLSQSDSQYRFCVRCKGFVDGVCKIHGRPMDSLNATKAVLTLPATMSIQKSSLPGAGLGVFALAVFEIGSLFGPMDGEILTKKQHEERGNNPYVWEVYTEGRKSISHYLDCINEEKSNWMRFVNCARFEEEQNLVAEQYDNLLFYKAYRRILPGQELLSWYGNAYGRQLRSEYSCPVTTDPIGSDDEYGIADLTGISSMNNDGLVEPVTVRFEDISYVTKDDQDLNLGNITVSAVVEEKQSVSEITPHTLQLNSAYQCHKCSALFASDYVFRRHQFYVCSVSRDFKCKKCSKLFKSKRSLAHHIKYSHENKQSFQCVVCSKLMSTKSNLKVHMKTHLNQRSYKCEECDKTFFRNTFLQSHIRSIHRKERPYICKICGKCFARSDNVTKHMRSHVNSVPCPVCGAEFLNSARLTRHCKKFHKVDNNLDKSGTCPICCTRFDDVEVHQRFVHGRCSVCRKEFANIHEHMSQHNKSSKKIRKVTWK